MMSTESSKIVKIDKISILRYPLKGSKYQSFLKNKYLVYMLLKYNLKILLSQEKILILFIQSTISPDNDYIS